MCLSSFFFKHFFHHPVRFTAPILRIVIYDRGKLNEEDFTLTTKLNSHEKRNYSLVTRVSIEHQRAAGRNISDFVCFFDIPLVPYASSYLRTVGLMDRRLGRFVTLQRTHLLGFSCSEIETPEPDQFEKKNSQQVF